MANEDSQPQGGTSGLTNGGAYNSYYNIRPADTVNGGGYSQNDLLQVVEAICNRDDRHADLRAQRLPDAAQRAPATPRPTSR